MHHGRTLLLSSILLLACNSDTKNGGAAGGVSGKLYYTQSTELEIHKLDLATGEDHKLGKGQEASVAPDGLIVYKTPTDIVESDESMLQQRYIMKSTTGSDRTAEGVAELQVSPDGTKVVYCTLRYNLYVLDRQSGDVLSSFEEGGSVGKGWYSPSWTPDGRIVVSGNFQNPGFYLSDAGFTKLDRFDPDFPQSMFADPNYLIASHDGTKVAFVRNKQVNVMNIDGTGLVTLDGDETAEDAYPVWSPDDSHIGWFGTAGHLEILAVNAPGGTPFDVLQAYPDLADKILIFETTNRADWK